MVRLREQIVTGVVKDESLSEDGRPRDGLFTHAVVARNRQERRYDKPIGNRVGKVHSMYSPSRP